jgi:catecholate siderophore receptor
MGQDVHSTRDVMQNHDYGAAPSISFGIGTSTQVTLNALLTHNNDMPDYGCRRSTARRCRQRKTFYGATDDRTIQDVVNLNGTITHKLRRRLTLRNQTYYSRYRSMRASPGRTTLARCRRGRLHGVPGANLGNITSLPLSSLYVGIGSHDRDITDTSLYNQTDVITSSRRAAAAPADRRAGARPRHERHAELLAQHPGNRTTTSAPSRSSIRSSAGGRHAGGAGNRVDAHATDVAPYINDTIVVRRLLEARGGVRYDRYHASLDELDQPAAVGEPDRRLHERSSRLIFQPTDASSYYVSYGTSFNPSLETLALTSGQQSLDPETSRQYELGAKWDVLDGNLSVTAAIFNIEKFNTRSQISPGVYELTGNVRVRGFQTSIAGRLTNTWQVFGGYTYLDAKIVEASVLDNTKGKVPANTPKNSASLWTAYNFTANGRPARASRTCRTGSRRTRTRSKVPDYFRWDAMVAYQQPTWGLQLNVFNVTDRLNYDSLIPSDRGRSVPGTNRSALLSISYKFL